jgi:DNA-3-methyladenine glycosylase II
MPTKKFTPRHVLKLKDQALRDVGLSWAKASYIKNLAEKVNNQEVRLEKLSKLDDEAVIAELVKVKGIGPWTAEMFLMFSLGREDVFSHGDLGLRNGLVKLYQLRKPPTIERANRIVNRWSPYKSYGSLALWHSLDNR